jgi:hypothetical protein
MLPEYSKSYIPIRMLAIPDVDGIVAGPFPTQMKSTDISSAHSSFVLLAILLEYSIQPHHAAQENMPRADRAMG